MNNLNDTLPDLMRRATDGLEPESTDLVERSMRRGLVLRRRRTALLSVAGAGAVLLTASVAVAASQLGVGASGDTQVAGSPSLSVGQAATPAARPVTAKDTLATLKQVLPAGVKITEPKSWGGPSDGFTAASVTVDDGKGLAEVGVLVEKTGPATCTSDTRNCVILADGSVLVTYTGPVYQPGHPNDRGVIFNYVDLTRRDGVHISLTAYNSRDEKDSPTTRPAPPYSPAQLTTMAESKLWKATPAKAPKKTGTNVDRNKIPAAKTIR
ncbi:MAG TPA: hypothetical protein VFT31_02660 [Kribbella sp.]|nr:hypothetical protein [Kribbella sp.]